MPRIPIQIGVANQGDGDTLFDAFTAVESNFVELYNDDAGDVRGVVGTAPIAAGIASNTATISLNDLGVTTAKLANDSVTYDKLGTEFTTAQTVPLLELDFSSAQVFTKAITVDSDITFANVGIGMVKDLILSGNAVPSFPVGSKIVAGTYSATADNLIQIVVAGTDDYWLSISQEQ